MKKVLGITAEYNPFHNGHEYHLARSLELTGADYTVAVMSGNFTQRGEMAIADKWTRSRAAVKCGIDLAVELPFVFACNRAVYFARGAVDTLVAMGATHIAFGCEEENPSNLREIARSMVREEEYLEERKSFFMSCEGISGAKAYEKALVSAFGDFAASIVSHPNNILAVEYLKRIEFWRSRGADIEDVPVRRRGSGYFEKGEMDGNRGFAGASEIRKMEEDGEAVCYMPEESAGEIGSMPDRIREYRSASEKAFEHIRGEIVRKQPEELASIFCVGEGLENKLKKEIVNAKSIDDLVSRMVSKRYTASAIRRILIYILVGLSGEDADVLLDSDRDSGVSYARILAAGRGGRELLNMAKKEETISVPVITNINKDVPQKQTLQNFRLLSLIGYDCLASDMYNLVNGRSLYDFSDKVCRPFIEI